jgi:hypothetical protein
MGEVPSNVTSCMYEELFSKDYCHHHSEGNYERVCSDYKRFDVMNILKRTAKYIFT